MSKIDEALVKLRQDVENPKVQSEFYDLFLNSSFFLPIVEEGEALEDGSKDIVPVITESGGNHYLMIFDTLERLCNWVPEEHKERYIEMPGHMLAMTTTAPLHLALNVGTDFAKQFVPDEIAWLRHAVEVCNANEAAGQAES